MFFILNVLSINDAPIIIADTKRINNIGWKPIYDIERGLDDTISWFKRN